MPIGVLGVGGLVSAYLMLPHVQSRVDRFLDPGSGDTFNVDRAIEAYSARDRRFGGLSAKVAR